MQFEVLARFVLGFLIGACIWAISHRARADSIPATTNTQTQPATSSVVLQYTVNGYQSTVGWFNSPGALMAGYVGWRNGQHIFCSSNGSGQAFETDTAGAVFNGYFTMYSDCGPYPDGTYQWQNSLAYVNYLEQNNTVYQCPSGWTLSNTTCSQTTYSCPTGYTLNGTMCNQNAPPIKPAGDPCGNIGIPAAASPGAGGCLNGTLCYFNQASNQYASGGQQMWYGPAYSSGQACSGQPNATSGTPQTQCPSGQVPGLINGQTVCFTASDSNPLQKVETKTQSTTNAQGQSTPGPTTTTTTTDKGPGGTTTTTKTSNPDGTSTTTTENNGPNTKPSDMGRFCQENPQSPMCKVSTWGGSCGGFQCDGDAVECAMAMEQYRRNCSLFDTPTSLSTLGNQVASGADPQASSNPALEANRQTVNLTNSLSQEAFLPQTGLSDQQFVVSPRLTVTLPWSQLNFYFSLMGGIVVAFAFVFAARIVIGAK